MAGKHLSLLVHFVWTTSGREPWISATWRDRLYGYLGGVLDHKHGKLICAGGMTDHIHVLASLPSTISLADIVNAMKANTSSWIHETFPNHSAFAWQRGYGAFSVSKSAEPQVIDYIRNQQEHHRVRSFQEEYLEFLKKHEIEYDERYLWN